MDTYISDFLSAVEMACSYDIDSGLIKQGEFRAFCRHQGIVIRKTLRTDTPCPNGYYPELRQLKHKLRLFDDHHDLDTSFQQGEVPDDEPVNIVASNGHISVSHPVIQNQCDQVASGIKDHSGYQFMKTEHASKLHEAFGAQANALTTHPPCSITLKSDGHFLVAECISTPVNKTSICIGEKVADTNLGDSFSHDYQPKNLITFFNSVPHGQVIHVGALYGTLMYELDGLKLFLLPIIPT
jgi:hypothetical protein